MLAIALSVAAAICWGAGDFAGGMLSRKASVFAVAFVGQVAALVICVVLVIAAGTSMPDFNDLVPAFLAGAFGVSGLVALFFALSIGRVSVVAPIAALSVSIPVVVDLVGGNVPAAIQLVGMALAVTGVVLASLEPDPEHRATPWRAIALAIAAAFGFGMFYVTLDSAAEVDVYWAIAAERVAAVALTGFAVVVVRVKLSQVKQLPAMAGVGLLDLIAVACFAVASTEGLVSLVSVVTSLFPAVTVILAMIVLHERMHIWQAVGVCLALTGVAFIAAG